MRVILLHTIIFRDFCKTFIGGKARKILFSGNHFPTVDFLSDTIDMLTDILIRLIVLDNIRRKWKRALILKNRPEKCEISVGNIALDSEIDIGSWSPIPLRPGPENTHSFYPGSAMEKRLHIDNIIFSESAMLREYGVFHRGYSYEEGRVFGYPDRYSSWKKIMIDCLLH